MKLTPGDVVALTANSPSAGDQRRTYPAGSQFRVRRLVTALPDLAEVRAEQRHGSDPRPRDRRTHAVGPLVEMVALTPDRSRLLFRPADLERVAAGATSADV